MIFLIELIIYGRRNHIFCTWSIQQFLVIEAKCEPLHKHKVACDESQLDWHIYGTRVMSMHAACGIWSFSPPLRTCLCRCHGREKWVLSSAERRFQQGEGGLAFPLPSGKTVWKMANYNLFGRKIGAAPKDPLGEQNMFVGAQTWGIT